MKIAIKDRAFGHAGFSGIPHAGFYASRHIEWDRSGTAPPSKTVYTDAEIFSAPVDYISKGAVAWLIEPIHGRQDAYDYLLKRADDFRRVWTHDEKLLTMIGNGAFVPLAGCWIPERHRKIHPKANGISTVASNKRGGVGYDLRHEAIRKLKDRIDAFGVEYMPLKNKEDALIPYRFHLAIENSRHDYWFTEKLIDCFATGTVPIYWGCPSIGRFFNHDGMFQVESMADIEAVVKYCTPEFYEARKSAIEENFNLAKSFYLAEDWIAELAPNLLEGLAL